MCEVISLAAKRAERTGRTEQTPTREILLHMADHWSAAYESALLRGDTDAAQEYSSQAYRLRMNAGECA